MRQESGKAMYEGGPLNGYLLPATEVDPLVDKDGQYVRIGTTEAGHIVYRWTVYTAEAGLSC